MKNVRDSVANDVAGFILAGGASTRMHRDKALLPVAGTLLIERALHLLKECGLRPGIVGTRPDLAHFAPVIPDRRSGCGPLSGLAAGLFAAASEVVLFLPVDLPLLPCALIETLLTRARITGALATLPQVSGQVQPLCAVYHRSLLPGITRALDAGDYKVMRVVTQAAQELGGSLDIYDVETVATAGHDTGWPLPAARAFLNCNTPEDVAAIEHHIQ